MNFEQISALKNKNGLYQISEKDNMHDGVLIWYENNLIHRLNEAAIYYPEGTLEWYEYGLIVKSYYPYNTYSSVNNHHHYTFYDKEGKAHREDGPAVISGYGEYWFKHGKHHRLDGPATEFYDGRKEWYIDGERINCSSDKEFDAYIKLKAFW